MTRKCVSPFQKCFDNVNVDKKKLGPTIGNEFSHAYPYLHLLIRNHPYRVKTSPFTTNFFSFKPIQNQNFSNKLWLFAILSLV